MVVRLNGIRMYADHIQIGTHGIPTTYQGAHKEALERIITTPGPVDTTTLREIFGCTFWYHETDKIAETFNHYDLGYAIERVPLEESIGYGLVYQPHPHEDPIFFEDLAITQDMAYLGELPEEQRLSPLRIAVLTHFILNPKTPIYFHEIQKDIVKEAPRNPSRTTYHLMRTLDKIINTRCERAGLYRRKQDGTEYYILKRKEPTAHLAYAEGPARR